MYNNIRRIVSAVVQTPEYEMCTDVLKFGQEEAEEIKATILIPFTNTLRCHTTSAQLEVKLANRFHSNGGAHLFLPACSTLLEFQRAQRSTLGVKLALIRLNSEMLFNVCSIRGEVFDILFPSPPPQGDQLHKVYILFLAVLAGVHCTFQYQNPANVSKTGSLFVEFRQIRNSKQLSQFHRSVDIPNNNIINDGLATLRMWI
jgi:hypothetical protein